MFRNAGAKIKSWAEVFFILGLFASILGGLSLAIDGGMTLPGVAVMVAGSLASWLSSLCLYGFGQLVASAENTESRLARMEQLIAYGYGLVPESDENANPAEKA